MKKENKVSPSGQESKISTSENYPSNKKGCETCHAYDLFLKEKELARKEKESYHKLNIELKNSLYRALTQVNNLHLN